MKRRELAIVFLLLAGCAAPRFVVDRGTRFIELSHPLEQGMPHWPGGVPFELKPVAGYRDGYYANKFSTAEHSGTHVDAPAHFVAGRRTVDRLPLSSLFAPAVVLSVAPQAARDPDHEVGAAEIRAWEERHGRIPAGALVLAHTGWAARWSDAARYRNQDAKGTMHFPGFSAEAARLLVRRGVAGIGIDTLSLDPGRSADFPVHKIAGAADVYLLENLRNLELLPPAGAWVVVAPLPIRGGSGAPARVIALLR